MNYGRLYIVCLALFLATAFSHAAYAETFTGPAIEFSVAKYEPSPAEPSKYVDVWLMAENKGTLDSSGVFVEFLQNFPLYAATGTNATANYGAIPAGGSIIKKFRLLVDAKAPQGTANLEIKYRTGGLEIQKTLGIEIRAREALLSITSAKAEPAEIPAGAKAKITLALENLAVKPLQDIIVRLDFSGGTFFPLDSVSERRISSLLPGEAKEISYGVIADPSAASGVYRLPVSITYSDIWGTNYTKSGVAGIIVNSPPSIELNVETKDPVQSGIAAGIVFSTSNTGPSNVKFLSISVLPSGTYNVIGRNREYLGNLNPDDFETAEFKVFIPESVKQADFSIRLDYRDAFNNEMSETRTLSVPVYSEADLSGLGIGQKAGYGTTLLAVIALVIAYYLYRRRKRKKA